VPKRVNKVVCAACGTANELLETDGTEQENWLPCVLPTGFEWNLPSGKITPVVGEPIYKDAMGKDFSREEYLTKYNIDPEIAYTKMRAFSKPCETTENKESDPVVKLGGRTKSPVHLGR
jgi:hypothetical protein